MNEIIYHEKTIRDFSSNLYSIESQVDYFNALFSQYENIPKPILFHYNQLFDLLQIVKEIINTMQKHNFADKISKCVEEYSNRMGVAGYPYGIWWKNDE